MRITVLIPCLNEQDTISDILHMCVQYYGNDSQIILIDNGSTDKSIKLAMNVAQLHENIQVLECPTKGKGNAIKHAVPFIKFDDVILQDADIEYSIPDTQKMAINHLEGDFDMSIGVRKSSLLLKSKCTNTLIKLLLLLRFKKTLPDILTGSRVVKTSLLDKCDSSKFGLETELSKIVLRDNLKIQLSKCSYSPRIVGKKIRFYHLTEIIYKAVT